MVMYQLSTKYTTNIGVTHDETQAVMITEQQYSTCPHANGQFCKIDASYVNNNKEIGVHVPCLYFIYHLHFHSL